MRSVWVILLCLLAVFPPQVCACDHTDHTAAPVEQHEHDNLPTDGHEHDDPAAPDCPCQCHLTPRDAVTAPRVALDSPDGLTFPVTDALVELCDPFRLMSVATPWGEPPPHGPFAALPLYLSTARLRN